MQHRVQKDFDKSQYVKVLWQSFLPTLLSVLSLFILCRYLQMQLQQKDNVHMFADKVNLAKTAKSTRGSMLFPYQNCQLYTLSSMNRFSNIKAQVKATYKKKTDCKMRINNLQLDRKNVIDIELTHICQNDIVKWKLFLVNKFTTL